MSTKMEILENKQVKLEIVVDAAEFDKSLDTAFAKNRGRYNIPGFRKGKAPRAMVERMYGIESLYEDAINAACPPAYEKAVEEHGLEPVDRPEIDVVSIGKGENLVFTATVPVKPDITLGEWKGVSVEKQAAEVSDDEVEKELARVQDRNGRMITVEDRPVAAGDTIKFDFAGTVDGVPFEGGTSQDYSLVIGSGSFIPGFEEQLIGVALGAEVDVNVTFPEEYHSTELAGKAAVFHCKINEIKVKELPALDDDFAKDVSEYDTLAEYKEDVKKRLTEKAEKAAQKALEEEAVNAAADTCTVEIPEAMVQTQLNNMMRQFDMTLRYQGMDLKRYMDMMGMTMEDFRGQYHDAAKGDVKVQLMLEKIVKTEGVTATDDEFEAELTEMSTQYGQTVEELKKQMHDHDFDDVRENICRRKAIKLITDSAVSA